MVLKRNPLYEPGSDKLPDFFDLVNWQELAKKHADDGSYLYNMFDAAHELKARGVIGQYEIDELCPLLKELLSKI